MADKFTRLTCGDGDILYGDSNSSDSLEELQDNIDAKLLTFIGQDANGGTVTGTTSETKVCSVEVAANSVSTHLLIIASLSYTQTGASGTGATADFKVKIGTADDTSGTQLSTTLVLGAVGDHNLLTGGSFVVVAVGGSDFTVSNKNYVVVTADPGHASNTCTCHGLCVFGI